MKIRAVGAELLHAARRADGLRDTTKLNSLSAILQTGLKCLKFLD